MYSSCFDVFLPLDQEARLSRLLSLKSDGLGRKVLCSINALSIKGAKLEQLPKRFFHVKICLLIFDHK
jgi:hypothetical protein